MEIPRQRPLILLVKVRSRKSKAFGIGEGRDMMSVIFQNLVRASNRTQDFNITKKIVFTELIPVYVKNYKRHMYKNAEFLTIKAGGTYNYHWPLG
jgi:hypothetical protein